MVSIRPPVVAVSATAKRLSSGFTAERSSGLSNRQPALEPETVQPSPGVAPWALSKSSDRPFQPYPGAVQALASTVSPKSRPTSPVPTASAVSCWR